MNKKGTNIILDNAIYIVLAVIFFSMTMYFLGNFKFATSFYEDYYSKEITKVINMAKPGDEVVLDVHKATEIAQKQTLGSYSEIFQFDNVNNEVCVKLSKGRKKCYSYFNDVSIVNDELRLADPINVLSFKVIDKEMEVGSENE